MTQDEMTQRMKWSRSAWDCLRQPKQKRKLRDGPADLGFMPLSPPTVSNSSGLSGRPFTGR